MSKTVESPLGPSTTSHNFIVDTGCTGHFLAVSAPYKNKQSTNTGISVRLPNQDIMTATHTAELDLPDLPQAARNAHIFPALGTTSLISVGQLCDAQCTAIFTKTTVDITHNDKTILKGIRTKTNNLWHATLPPKTNSDNHHTNTNTSPEQRANNVNQTKKAAALVAFAHGALFSPALSTLQQALDKNYVNHFPGLTPQTLRQHPPQSIAMIKGHLDQSRQNQRSTKPKVTIQETMTITKTPNDAESSPTTEPNKEVEQTTEEDYWPQPEGGNERTHQCFAATTEDSTSGKIFTDQTGRFISPSSNGNTQLFLLYDYDSNSIHAEPIKNRTATEIL